MCPIVLNDIHAEIVVEDSRDKIFVTEILAANGHGLSHHENSHITGRRNLVTSAIVQGAPLSLQRGIHAE